VQIALRNPVIERIREEYGERERQRIMDRVLNQRRHRNEIQGDQLEGRLFNPVSTFKLLKAIQIEEVPEDFLPDIPRDLSPTETDPSKIEESFERQYRARQATDKNRRKRDQKKRQQLRKMLQQQP
jgi:hypothetical protein